MQHRYPAGRLALALGGWFVLAVAAVGRLRVSQTFGNVMLYIRVVFGGARLDPLGLADLGAMQGRAEAIRAKTLR